MLSNILQIMYDSEINFSIHAFWDGGFDVGIGDPMNGWADKATVVSIKDVEIFFKEGVIKHFPDSRASLMLKTSD